MGSNTASTQSSAFTYRLYDLLNGTVLGALPFRGVSFSSALNSPGSFSGTLDLQDARVQNLSPLELTQPEHTFLAVDYLGSIVWGGAVAIRRWDVAQAGAQTSRTLTVQATEPWSYFGQRVQATDYSAPPYSGIDVNPTVMPIWDANASISLWDPALIASQVIVDALGYSQTGSVSQGNPLGGLVVLVNGFRMSGGSPQTAAYLASPTATSSANYISINYPYTSLQTVDAIVSQLAGLGLGVGFDYAVDTAYSSGSSYAITGTVNLSTPRRGRTTAQNNLVLDLTRARAYSFPEDGPSTGNTIYTTGGGGAIVVQQNVNPLTQGYPLLERVLNFSQIQSGNIDGVLAEVSFGAAYQYSYPPVAPTVTMPVDGTLPLGSFITGDDVQVVMPATQTDGTVYDPRFPAGLNQEWRIQQWACQVADQGDSTVQFTLNQPPVNLPLAPAI